jgi:hypothetical protein
MPWAESILDKVNNANTLEQFKNKVGEYGFHIFQIGWHRGK